MKRATLKKILYLEMEKYENKTYDALLTINYPYIYEIEYDGQTFTIEMELLEQKDEYLNVGFIIDAIEERKFINQIFPVGSNIIIDK